MKPTTNPLPITVQEIWEARKRMQTMVTPTPLISSPHLPLRQGVSAYFKLEHIHEIGAFKIRGAANKILKLSADERKRGVTTFSTGNHGLAVAYIAQKLGIRAIICISNRVPDVKVKAIEAFQAEIVRVGNRQDDAAKHCYQLEREHGLTVIPPFDDRDVIAGQGTIGLELMEDLPQIDTVIIPLSGGGLLSGIALALKSSQPSIRIIGVSMENAAVMAASLKAGKPVELDEEETLADSLLGGIGLENQYTFPMVQSYLDDLIHVSEQEIEEAMFYLLKEHRMIVEGAAATGVAALLTNKFPAESKTIATVITGNNVDINVVSRILQKHIDRL